MKTPLPRLLLVEDDPVSATFLRDAALALPAHVDIAGSMSAALASAAPQAHDLLLIDAHLPDGDGPGLLHALHAAGIDAPALAHTASADADLQQRLLHAGFLDVLVKPLDVAGLHAALRRHLPSPSNRVREPAADWNDAGALAALGEATHVDALRGLFLQELPAQRGRIALAAGDESAIRTELHRLAASCGFVGAHRLGDAVRLLQADPRDADAMRAFLAAADALIP